MDIDMQEEVNALTTQQIKTYFCSLKRGMSGVFMGKINNIHIQFDLNHELSRGFDIYYPDQNNPENTNTRVKIVDNNFRSTLIAKAENMAKEFKGVYNVGLGGDMLYVQMIYKNGYSFYKLGKSNNPQKRFDGMYKGVDLDVEIFNIFDAGDQAYQLENLYKRLAGKPYIPKQLQSEVPCGYTEFYHILQYPMMVFNILNKRIWFKGYECNVANISLQNVVSCFREFEHSLEHNYESKYLGVYFKEASWKSKLAINLKGVITKS